MPRQTSRHSARNFFLLLLAMGAAIAVLRAALSQDQTTKNKTEKTTGRDSAEVSGAKLFHYYCASCHGADGKGHGPAAPSLKVEPADLTLLSQKNDGKFPADHVLYVLSNEG